MSSIHYAHQRTSPPSTRKSFVRTPRSALLGASKVSVKGNGKAKQATEKPKEKVSDIPAEDYDDDDDMATSFLQFCTTCDRQILVPKNSLLYCSERCKRIDAEHVPDYSSFAPLNTPTFIEEPDADAFGTKRRTPVERAVPTPRPMLSARILSNAHEGKADLDPTEWKPKLPHRPTSDASKYLGQFHRTPPRSLSPRRPVAIHVQSTSSVPLTAPSLSATPSASSTSSGDSVAGTPYNFANRPLMHANSVAIKSVDLVTPQIPLAYTVPTKPARQAKCAIKITGPPVAPTGGATENVALAGDLSYEKKWNLADFHGSSGSGRLATLLASTSLEHKAAM